MSTSVGSHTGIYVCVVYTYVHMYDTYVCMHLEAVRCLPLSARTQVSMCALYTRMYLCMIRMYVCIWRQYGVSFLSARTQVTSDGLVPYVCLYLRMYICMIRMYMCDTYACMCFTYMHTHVCMCFTKCIHMYVKLLATHVCMYFT